MLKTLTLVNAAQTESPSAKHYSLNTIQIGNYDDKLLCLYIIPIKKERTGFGISDELITPNDLQDNVMPILTNILANSNYELNGVGCENGKHRYCGIIKNDKSDMTAADLVWVIEAVSKSEKLSVPHGMIEFKEKLEQTIACDSEEISDDSNSFGYN